MSPETPKVIREIKKRTRGKKVVFVSGFFNLVHPGHLRLLRFAAECGNYLVVGVYGDAKGNSLLEENFRLEGVKAIKLVNYAFILKDSLDEFLRELKPDIVVKGKEHEHANNLEETAVNSYGGSLLFSSGEMSFSLAELLKDESRRLVSSDFIRHDAFMQRRGFTWKDLESVVQSFQSLKVTVIGEVIVDEYITCDSLGMSREDPTVVVTPITKDKYLGGAGIVAAHAGNMGADVSLFSMTGADEMAYFIRKKLEKFGIKDFLFTDDSRPTILKQRFRSSGKTLLRVNHLRQHPISREHREKILSRFLDVIEDSDIVIFSDFNYGFLQQELVDGIMSACKKRDIMMVADSQSSSQIGDVSRFSDMMLLTPTEREARLALKDFESGLVVLAEKLRKKTRAGNVFITLDKEGMLIHAAPDNGKSPFLTDRLSAMNTAPVDPAGAGDSLLACSSLALASGADIWQSAYLGSLAAACQIARGGNIPLSVHEMFPGASL